MFVMVNVANRELTPEEIVEIQMSEKSAKQDDSSTGCKMLLHDLIGIN